MSNDRVVCYDYCYYCGTTVGIGFAFLAKYLTKKERFGTIGLSFVENIIKFC